MDIEEWASAYRNGESLDSIARRSGVSRGKVRKALKDVVAIRKPGHTRPGPRELGPEWDDLGRIPDTLLAERIGCTRQNVAKVRWARGIPSFMETVRKNVRADNTDRGTDV